MQLEFKKSELDRSLKRKTGLELIFFFLQALAVSYAELDLQIKKEAYALADHLLSGLQCPS